MIKGAVFYMDGLMFDTERLVYETWQMMMDELGFEYNLNIFKNTIGLRTDMAESYYNSLYGDGFCYAELKKKSREIFLNRISKEGVPIKKGLFQLLEFLKANNIKIAVATSTSAQTAHNVIKIAGAYDYFDAFVCGDDVQNSKPHPEIFLTASQKLGICPEYCVALEDSINGIKAAYTAKMTTIMVPDYLQPTKEILPMISCLCEDLSSAKDFISQKIHTK